MIISIPKKLTPLVAVNFAKAISECESAEEYIYDFGDMQHCHPFGLLVIASAIRRNMERLNEARHSVINTEVTQGGQFAASFGFYQSIGFNIGLAKDEDEEGDRYIPIKKISAQDLHSEYLDTLMLNEKVNRHAATLSQMLIGNQPTVVQDALQYCFREIMRNTFEHANIDSLWVCGQYWPARKEAEIAVLDEGIGVFSLAADHAMALRCEESRTLR